VGQIAALTNRVSAITEQRQAGAEVFWAISDHGADW
jgi:hypothetical protein